MGVEKPTSRKAFLAMSIPRGGKQAANPQNPQSWNRYAFVVNDPLGNIDPTGLDCIYVNPDGTVDVKEGDCYDSSDDGYYVDGTIDLSSFTYNPETESLGYSFTSDDGVFGRGIIVGADVQSDDGILGPGLAVTAPDFPLPNMGRPASNGDGAKANDFR